MIDKIDYINYNLQFEKESKILNLEEIEFHNTNFIKNNLANSKLINCISIVSYLIIVIYPTSTLINHI